MKENFYKNLLHKLNVCDRILTYKYNMYLGQDNKLICFREDMVGENIYRGLLLLPKLFILVWQTLLVV